MAGGSFCLLLACLLGLSGRNVKCKPDKSTENGVNGCFKPSLEDHCTAGVDFELSCCICQLKSCQEVSECFRQYNASSSSFIIKMPEVQENIYVCMTMQDSSNIMPTEVVSQGGDSTECLCHQASKLLRDCKCTPLVGTCKVRGSVICKAETASTFYPTLHPATETHSITIASTLNQVPNTRSIDTSTVAQETSTEVITSTVQETSDKPSQPSSTNNDLTKEPGIITVITILLFIIVFVLVIILGIIIIIKKRRKSVFRISGNEESSMENGNGTSSTYRTVAFGKRSSPDGALDTETTTYADVELTSKQPPIDNAGYAFVTSSPDDVIAVRNNAIYEDIDAVSNQSPTNCNTNTAIISPVYAMPPDAVNAAENPSGVVYAEPYQALSSAAVPDPKAGTNEKTLSPGADQNTNVIYSQPIKSKNASPNKPNAIYSQAIKQKN